MSIQLKDIIHLYIGCEVEYEGIINGKEIAEEKKLNKDDRFYVPQVEAKMGTKIGVLKLIEYNTKGEFRVAGVGRKVNKKFWGVPNIKLLLRPLSDMTEEELRHVLNMCYTNVYGHDPEFQLVTIVSDETGGGVKATEDNGKWNYGLTVTTDGVNFSVNGDFLFVKQFEMIAYLLSRGFDLFDLIPSGQAKTKE